MRFSQWARSQPRGTLKRIERERGVGYNTLARLMRGETLSDYHVAKRISEATGGKVSVAELCEEDTSKVRARRAVGEVR